MNKNEHEVELTPQTTKKSDAKQKETNKALKEKEQTRYFIDENYDKKVYENSCGNIFFIIGIFLVYYASLLIIFWGTVSLGATAPTALIGVNVSIFGITLIIVGCMLYSGKKSNYK
jgi:hypothetical protein